MGPVQTAFTPFSRSRTLAHSPPHCTMSELPIIIYEPLRDNVVRAKTRREVSRCNMQDRLNRKVCECLAPPHV